MLGWVRQLNRCRWKGLARLLHFLGAEGGGEIALNWWRWTLEEPQATVRGYPWGGEREDPSSCWVFSTDETV